MTSANGATGFRRLHEPGQLLLLPNAWDAASARTYETCGAAAIAVPSAVLAWSRGMRVGRLPPRVLGAAAAEIVRGLSVPLTVDVGVVDSTGAGWVGETVSALADAGVAGIDIGDGAAPPDVLCTGIAAAKAAAARAGVDLFVNARTDVYLRRLVTVERAVPWTIARARGYHAAGCDGVFVPGVADAYHIRCIASAIELPLNVMQLPIAPPLDRLRALGVRRVSAGFSVATRRPCPSADPRRGGASPMESMTPHSQRTLASVR